MSWFGHSQEMRLDEDLSGLPSLLRTYAGRDLVRPTLIFRAHHEHVFTCGLWSDGHEGMDDS